MIEIETCQLAEHHLLHAFPSGQRSTPLPCIVFYHGFTSSSLVYSYFSVALAQAGFRVIMPDAAGHGARFNGDEQARMGRFWQILQQSMQEFTALRAALRAENWLLEERLAVGGASMGAMTALGIMTQHPEVKCVASLMGSGYFTRLARTLFPPLRPGHTHPSGGIHAYHCAVGEVGCVAAACQTGRQTAAVMAWSG